MQKKMILYILLMPCTGCKSLRQLFGILFGQCKYFPALSDYKPPLSIYILIKQPNFSGMGQGRVKWQFSCLLYCYYSSRVNQTGPSHCNMEHYRNHQKVTTLQILSLQGSTVGLGERSTWFWKCRLLSVFIVTLILFVI